MKLFKSTQASISLIVAFFLALLLITTITVSFLLILENHNQSTTTGVEYQKQTLKGVREQLQATLIDANNSHNPNNNRRNLQHPNLHRTNGNNSIRHRLHHNQPTNRIPTTNNTQTLPLTNPHKQNSDNKPTQHIGLL